MKIRYLVAMAAAIVIVLLAVGLVVMQAGRHAGVSQPGAHNETFRPGFALGGHSFGMPYYPLYYYGNWPYPYPGYSYGYSPFGPGLAFDRAATRTQDVQQALTKGGYYRGPIDGNLGESTGAAISAYQREKGLPVTGDIDAKLLSSLGLK